MSYDENRISDLIEGGLQAMIDIQKSGELPLSSIHPCFDKGHSMSNVYTFHNHQSSYGQNKCYRCGWIEDFQYDYPNGYNPMYNQK